MKHILVTAVLICSFILIAGCRHQQTATANDPKPVVQKSQPKAVAAKPTNPNNILLNIKKGMTPEEVRNLVGNPQSQGVYPTGKSWIPFYYGADRNRMYWRYGDYGEIVFSINSYSGRKQVYEVRMK